MALCTAYLLRCNVSIFLFGICIACIAIYESSYWVTNIKPLRGWKHCSLFVKRCSLFVKLTSPKPFSLIRNGEEEARRGIKAWPENGSGVERGGGHCKRYQMSHAAGVANSIAWKFHPRGTHRVGLFSLDFLWFFLVSRQERTCKPLFAMLYFCDATHHHYSLEKVLRASPIILNTTIPRVKTLG